MLNDIEDQDLTVGIKCWSTRWRKVKGRDMVRSPALGFCNGFHIQIEGKQGWMLNFASEYNEEDIIKDQTIREVCRS
jgi:hypothetical protein